MDGPAQLSRHRRSVSAPSLDSLAESALGLETTPCSVLQLRELDDEVAVSLRLTLEQTRSELAAAVEDGVLDSGTSGGRRYGSDSAAASDAEEGRRTRAGSPRRGSGGSEQHRGSSADPEATETGAELELGGLSAREREAALKRARNRDAARRSRERKAERIAGLRSEAERLGSTNFVLLKCVEEVASKALHARAEQHHLKLLLARLTEQKLSGARDAAVKPADGMASTPTAATQAAALERELLLLEAHSPAHLLPLPLWPEHAADDDEAAALIPLPARLMPTSAELRRELKEAVVGSGSQDCGTAAEHHLLHPSPVAGSRRPLTQRQQHAPQQHAPSMLQLKQGMLARTCSAPGGLMAGAAADVGVAEQSQPWFKGVVA
ncbi:hypothetical protein D9Q98_005687 [Chlorella vulgaris]|uniref:BZIP domain-containing protein n=1 Tax=Chlorella vulgaris TaxID=3077 RepID=A0A9D4TMF8_CHLVU|nr:hypothetical protein D9Q98_005687 [Chlorella vulgaris]